MNVPLMNVLYTFAPVVLLMFKTYDIIKNNLIEQRLNEWQHACIIKKTFFFLIKLFSKITLKVCLLTNVAIRDTKES